MPGAWPPDSPTPRWSSASPRPPPWRSASCGRRRSSSGAGRPARRARLGHRPAGVGGRPLGALGRARGPGRHPPGHARAGALAARGRRRRRSRGCWCCRRSRSAPWRSSRAPMADHWVEHAAALGAGALIGAGLTALHGGGARHPGRARPRPPAPAESRAGGPSCAAARSTSSRSASRSDPPPLPRPPGRPTAPRPAPSAPRSNWTPPTRPPGTRSASAVRPAAVTPPGTPAGLTGARRDAAPPGFPGLVRSIERRLVAQVNVRAAPYALTVGIRAPGDPRTRVSPRAGSPPEVPARGT